MQCTFLDDTPQIFTVSERIYLREKSIFIFPDDYIEFAGKLNTAHQKDRCTSYSLSNYVIFFPSVQYNLNDKSVINV